MLKVFSGSFSLIFSGEIWDKTKKLVVITTKEDIKKENTKNSFLPGSEGFWICIIKQVQFLCQDDTYLVFVSSMPKRYAFCVCSFMEKFERISKKIVKVLARLPAAASLLQRGATTRRASVIFFARDFFSRFVRVRKGFLVSLPRPPVRGYTISLNF